MFPDIIYKYREVVSASTVKYLMKCERYTLLGPRSKHSMTGTSNLCIVSKEMFKRGPGLLYLLCDYPFLHG